MATITMAQIAVIAAEAHAGLAEMYRENIAKYPGVANTYKRYTMREKMVEHQNRAAEIMATVPQEAR
jgi:phosphomannomutase